MALVNFQMSSIGVLGAAIAVSSRFCNTLACCKYFASGSELAHLLIVFSDTPIIPAICFWSYLPELNIFKNSLCWLFAASFFGLIVCKFLIYNNFDKFFCY